jgi:hypothetical protein
LGIAEDTGDASIVCRQIGPSNIVGNVKDGEARPKAVREASAFRRLSERIREHHAGSTATKSLIGGNVPSLNSEG